MTTEVKVDVIGLDHVVLRTSNPPRMVAFYCGVLGCAVERTVDELGLIQLRAGASLIDLVDTAGKIGRAGGAPPAASGRNLDHFCLRIADVDLEALRHGLAGKGVRGGDIGRRYGADGYGQSLYIEDPDGNVVELKGPPEPA